MSYAKKTRYFILLCPASGAAIVFRPGINFANSNATGPCRIRMSSVLRTQEAASKENLQTQRVTVLPYRPPSRNQMKSATAHPAIAASTILPIPM